MDLNFVPLHASNYGWQISHALDGINTDGTGQPPGAQELSKALEALYPGGQDSSTSFSIRKKDNQVTRGTATLQKLLQMQLENDKLFILNRRFVTKQLSTISINAVFSFS